MDFEKVLVSFTIYLIAYFSIEVGLRNDDNGWVTTNELDKKKQEIFGTKFNYGM